MKNTKKPSRKVVAKKNKSSSDKLHTFHSKKNIHKIHSDNNELKKWLKIALWGSGFSIILGLLIYKSFFFLAIFLPLSVVGIWHFIKKIEKHVQKFDVFAK